MQFHLTLAVLCIVTARDLLSLPTHLFESIYAVYKL